MLRKTLNELSCLSNRSIECFVNSIKILLGRGAHSHTHPQGGLRGTDDRGQHRDRHLQRPGLQVDDIIVHSYLINICSGLRQEFALPDTSTVFKKDF